MDIYIYGYGGVLKLGYPQIILKLNHPYKYSTGQDGEVLHVGAKDVKLVGNFETKTPQDPISWEETIDETGDDASNAWG